MNIEAMPPWEPIEPPYAWEKHGLVVIGDRHMPDGRRQHVVRGSVPTGTALDNADIFGEDESSWVAQRSASPG